MHRHTKPIRKCHGCGLNFRDHCGIYPVPREMWERGRCPGYKNPDLLADYERQQAARTDATTSDDRRRCTQRLKATEPHHQGRRDPSYRPADKPPVRPAGTA